MTEWKPIHTAPAFERVLVCGRQPPSGTVAGYWWWHEDVTGADGQPTEHPAATHWAPIVLPDRFPPSPGAIVPGEPRMNHFATLAAALCAASLAACGLSKSAVGRALKGETFGRLLSLDARLAGCRS